jgi:epoxyqueuosine reductase QueG
MSDFNAVYKVLDDSKTIYGTTRIERDHVFPNARSALVFGLPVPKSIFKSSKPLHNYWRTANLFYRHLDTLAVKIALILEGKGYESLPVFGCFPFRIEGLYEYAGFVNLIELAVKCGLGKLSKSSMLINPEFGTRLILAGVLTEAELEEIRREAGYGCPEDCFECIRVCPAKALEPYGIDVKKCIRTQSFSPIFVHLLKSGNWRLSDEIEILQHVTVVDDHNWYMCIECTAKCPMNY